MSKICAKCSKTVYPLEELKCLDKVWHKGCFKCWECGMTLNMKNYKGYDKKPYCVAHYPQTKATVVADTPEMARIAHNTKIQSQVKYHEEFEKMKGSKIEVADDPEIRRVKRIGSVVSQIEYKSQKEKPANLDARRTSLPYAANAAVESVDDEQRPSPYSARSTSNSTVYGSSGTKAHAPTVRRVGSIADYDPVNDNYGSLTLGYHPTSRTNSMTQEWEESIPISPSAAAGGDLPGQSYVPDTSTIDESGEPTETDKESSLLATSSSHAEVEKSDAEPLSSSDDRKYEEPEAVYTPEVGVVSLQENDNNVETELVEPHDTGLSNADTVDSSDGVIENTVHVYRALFSYSAQDDDEVSFEEGDLILEAELIDEGWMVGTVQRTGNRGMMPSNYFELTEDD